jgi:hypothetical protein
MIDIVIEVREVFFRNVMHNHSGMYHNISPDHLIDSVTSSPFCVAISGGTRTFFEN